jgi:ABC-type spermidine/putrescine transport system permease subunit II
VGRSGAERDDGQPDLQTLPVKMWTTLRQDLSPVIAVASTLLIGLSVLVMVIAAACAGAPKSAPERPEKTT